MQTYTRNDIKHALLWAILLGFTTALSAKGLDEIQPRSTEEKAETTPQVSEPPAKTPVEGVEKIVPTEEKKAPANVETGNANAKKEEKPVEPSTLSKKLSERLSLSAGFGWYRIPKAKLGEFSSQGVAELSANWYAWRSHDLTKLLGISFRYTPVHTENLIEGQSYKSVIEGYHLGLNYGRVYSDQKLVWFGGLEVGYLLVYMESRDRFPVSESSEANELAFTFGTGLDWKMLEKLKIGPRIYVGFGNFQTIQFSINSTLLF